MQPRSSSLPGCFSIISAIIFLFFSYAVLRLIAKVPARAYTPLELWTAFVTFGIPISYVLMIFVGRWRSHTPDPDPAGWSAWVLRRFHEERSEQVYALVLVVFVLSVLSGMGWFLFNQLLNSITPVQLQWWAVLATAGTLLAAGTGYALGATPMEGERRIALAFFIALFFLFGIPYSIYLWIHRSALPISFWASLPLSIIGIVLTWRYFAAGWEPDDLSWNDTWIDRRINTTGRLHLVGFILLAGMIALDIVFGGRSWIFGGLLPWLLFMLSYMVIQAWQHRPR